MVGIFSRSDVGLSARSAVLRYPGGRGLATMPHTVTPVSIYYYYHYTVSPYTAIRLRFLQYRTVKNKKTTHRQLNASPPRLLRAPSSLHHAPVPSASLTHLTFTTVPRGRSAWLGQTSLPAYGSGYVKYVVG